VPPSVISSTSLMLLPNFPDLRHFFRENQSKLHPRAVIEVRIFFWGSIMGKEKKPGKDTTMKENTGKLLLDLGKLVVGGIIISGILRGAIPQVILIASGSAVALGLFILEFLWTMKEKKEDKE